MRRLIVISFLFLGLNAGHAHDEACRHLLNSPIPPGNEVPSLGFFSRLINEGKVSSLEGLLKLLPASYLERFALIYSSRSAQGASFNSPRAVVFGQNSNTMIAFNGSPKQKGFENLEVIEFDEASGAYEFRRITFGGGGKKPAVSERNPRECFACHRGKPIWDMRIWPGFYGPDLLDEPGSEMSRFRHFFEANRTNPRYLPLLQAQGMGLGTYNNLWRDTDEHQLLDIFLLSKNAKHVATSLIDYSRKNPKLIEPFLASLLNNETCRVTESGDDPDQAEFVDFLQFFPSAARPGLKRRYRELVIEVEDKIRSYRSKAWARRKRALGQPGSSVESETTSPPVFHSGRDPHQIIKTVKFMLAFEAFGLPNEVASWGQTLEGGVPDFLSGVEVQDFYSMLLHQYLVRLAKWDLKFQPLAAAGRSVNAGWSLEKPEKRVPVQVHVGDRDVFDFLSGTLHQR